MHVHWASACVDEQAKREQASSALHPAVFHPFLPGDPSPWLFGDEYIPPPCKPLRADCTLFIKESPAVMNLGTWHKVSDHGMSNRWLERRERRRRLRKGKGWRDERRERKSGEGGKGRLEKKRKETEREEEGRGSRKGSGEGGRLEEKKINSTRQLHTVSLPQARLFWVRGQRTKSVRGRKPGFGVTRM